MRDLKQIQLSYDSRETVLCLNLLKAIKKATSMIFCVFASTVAKNSSMAVEALAGLASKEDFSAVSLRKSASTSALPNGTTLLPFKEIMLLQIKGRRHIQTRLVEPIASSINSGDNFVLVTPSQVNEICTF